MKHPNIAFYNKGTKLKQKYVYKYVDHKDPSEHISWEYLDKDEIKAIFTLFPLFNETNKIDLYEFCIVLNYIRHISHIQPFYKSKISLGSIRNICSHSLGLTLTNESHSLILYFIMIMKKFDLIDSFILKQRASNIVLIFDYKTRQKVFDNYQSYFHYMYEKALNSFCNKMVV